MSLHYCIIYCSFRSIFTECGPYIFFFCLKFHDKETRRCRRLRRQWFWCYNDLRVFFTVLFFSPVFTTSHLERKEDIALKMKWFSFENFAQQVFIFPWVKFPPISHLVRPFCAASFSTCGVKWQSWRKFCLHYACRFFSVPWHFLPFFRIFFISFVCSFFLSLFWLLSVPNASPVQCLDHISLYLIEYPLNTSKKYIVCVSVFDHLVNELYAVLHEYFVRKFPFFLFSIGVIIFGSMPSYKGFCGKIQV